MKKIVNGVSCLALCLSLSVGALAQDKDKDKDKDKDRYKPGTEKADKDKDRDGVNDHRSDKEMNERLTRDVYTRNPAVKDQVIVWDNNDEGYEGTYAVGNEKYMARYDEQGNYVETLVEKKWDDNVSANIRSSYNNSMYRSNKVERFWEVNEPTRRGYYIQIKDNDGKTKRIWWDRDGKFSEPPRKKVDH